MQPARALCWRAVPARGLVSRLDAAGMRECGCGYTCGTVAALQLHLDLALSSDCQPLPEQPWDDASHLSTALLQLGRLEVLEDPNERLMLAARAGDAAEVQQLLSSGGAEMSEAILDAAVRGGHVAATSALLLHCRSRRPQYDRPLDGVNSVANVLNWAAAGYSGLAGPLVIAMIVKVRRPVSKHTFSSMATSKPLERPASPTPTTHPSPNPGAPPGRATQEAAAVTGRSWACWHRARHAPSSGRGGGGGGRADGVGCCGGRCGGRSGGAADCGGHCAEDSGGGGDGDAGRVRRRRWRRRRTPDPGRPAALERTLACPSNTLGPSPSAKPGRRLRSSGSRRRSTYALRIRLGSSRSRRRVGRRARSRHELQRPRT